jgi:hypothetical protein
MVDTLMRSCCSHHWSGSFVLIGQLSCHHDDWYDCVCDSSEETCLMTTGRQCFMNDVGVPLMGYHRVLGIQGNPRQVLPPSVSKGDVFPMLDPVFRRSVTCSHDDNHVVMVTKHDNSLTFRYRDRRIHLPQ